MRKNLTFHKGNIKKPAIIFIHGLGMDKRIWANPDDARILGGSFPLRYILAQKPRPAVLDSENKKSKILLSRFSAGEASGNLITSFQDLKSLGYTVITWSQKKPVGPIESAVEELKDIMKIAKAQSREGIILIGHSRGGLIARKYLEGRDKAVKGLITLATPHHGSTMARWAGYISPLASIIGPLIHEDDRKKFSFTIKRILNFIDGKAIKELLPDSELVLSLKNPACRDMHCLSLGGTSPNLFALYGWKTGKKSLSPSVLFSFPNVLEKIIPGRIYPIELKSGHGDGLVSAKSSIMPDCDNHFNFKVNHAGILFDESVRKKIIKAVEAI